MSAENYFRLRDSTYSHSGGIHIKRNVSFEDIKALSGNAFGVLFMICQLSNKDYMYSSAGDNRYIAHKLGLASNSVSRYIKVLLDHDFIVKHEKYNKLYFVNLKKVSLK